MVGFALLVRATLAPCYVVPEALHQGVGRALLQHVEVHARKAGLAILDLESTRTAEHFYRRHGYVPHGAVQTWAGLKAQPMRKRRCPSGHVRVCEISIENGLLRATYMRW
eukprot:gene36195-59252_t